MKKLVPWLMLVLTLANSAVFALYTSKLPDGQYPAHYGIDGMPDRYGSKWEMAAFSCVAIILAIGYIIYRAATKNNEKIQKNAKYEDKFIPIIIVIMAAIPWGMMLTAVSGVQNLNSVSPKVLGGVVAAIGLLMAFTANISGKIKPNRTFGLRTSATLSDERVWRRAHRLLGYTGLAGSLVTVACGIAVVLGAKPVPVILIIGLAAMIVGGVIIPAIYASCLYRKLNSGYNEEEKTENE